MNEGEFVIPASGSRVPTWSKDVLCIDDLVLAAIKASEGWELSNVWYRGQGKADGDWLLQPSVYRGDRYTRFMEISMCQRFMLLAPTRYGRCPGAQEYGQWLALMQHYRLPTRLLDWTESLIVATYMMVEEKYKDSPGTIWVLCPKRLNQVLDKTADAFVLDDKKEPTAKFVCGAFYSNIESTGVIAAHAPEVDVRMLVQSATFTIHGDRVPLEEHPEVGKFLVRINVSPEAKTWLKASVYMLGARSRSVFPDLEHLAADLAEEALSIPRGVCQS